MIFYLSHSYDSSFVKQNAIKGCRTETERWNKVLETGIKRNAMLSFFFRFMEKHTFEKCHLA